MLCPCLAILHIFIFFSNFRFILTSFVCLLTGAAFGRELACFEFTAKSATLWPAHEQVYIRNLDLSTKFETEKHSFKLTPAKKFEIKTFQIHESPQLDFIPLGILSEFPNLDGLIILHCNLPTVKSGLFKPDFGIIEYLSLQGNKIEKIEAEAFQYLINLKWLDLYKNSLKTLSHQIFKNNPDLAYIDLNYNQMLTVHPNFFDGLEKLKLIEFRFGNYCLHSMIGCETCSIDQTEIKSKLQTCFDYCLEDKECQNS
jgi:hypothetical protein